MGKILTAEQAKAERLAKLQVVAAKAAATIRKAGIRVGDVEVHHLEANRFIIQIEASEKVSASIVDAIPSDFPGTLIATQDHPGTYMWDADTYIKPVSVATVKF